jgi:uncharacterized membrane protein
MGLADSASGAPTQAGANAKTSVWRSLRDTFVAGIAVMLPLAITLWLISIIWDVLNSPFADLLRTVARWAGTRDEPNQLLMDLSDWPGLGLLVSLGVVMLAGVLARNLLGKHFIQWVDELAGKVPLVRAIYTSVKQVSDTVFTSAGKQAFRRPVLVRFPTPESYAIGFVTGEPRGAVQEAASEKVVNVFVPTAPNPTSGFLLMVPEGQLIPLNMSVEDAFKMVVSGGVVMPPAPAGAPKTAAERPPAQLRD